MLKIRFSEDGYRWSKKDNLVFELSEKAEAKYREYYSINQLLKLSESEDMIDVPKLEKLIEKYEDEDICFEDIRSKEELNDDEALELLWLNYRAINSLGDERLDIFNLLEANKEEGYLDKYEWIYADMLNKRLYVNREDFEDYYC